MLETEVSPATSQASLRVKDALRILIMLWSLSAGEFKMERPTSLSETHGAKATEKMDTSGYSLRKVKEHAA